MTQTVRDTVTRAMRMLGVIIAGVAPGAVEADNGVDAYNAMLHGWKGQGVDIGHIDQGLNDDVALDPMFYNAVTALLAVELSGEYEVQVPSAVVVASTNGWSALQAKYIIDSPDQDMTVETALRYIGTRRNVGGWYTG